jgi:CRP/FNR family transcriptional regulator
MKVPPRPPTTRLNVICCGNCPALARSIFRSVSSRARDAVQAHRVDVASEKGENVPLKHGSADGFVCIRSGYAKVIYKYAGLARPVSICGPGDLVGYGYWHCDDRLALEALEDVGACFFTKTDFEALVREEPEMSEELRKVLCRNALQKAERIGMLQSRSVHSRVAALLASLERKFGERAPNGSRIPVGDRETLAALSGTVVETLARVLTHFEENGWIVREGRRLRVRNRNALNALAHDS